MSQSDLIVFSHLRWTFVYQRPQHLIARLARGRRTWFVEEPLPYDGDETRLRCQDVDGVTRVWLEVPSDEAHLNFGAPGSEGYLDALRALMDEPVDPWVWLYTPLAWDLAQRLDPAVLVYDVMDDLAAFKYASEAMVLRQHQAIASADVVFAGGRSLFEKVQKHRDDRAHLFPSGVEPEHYAVAREHRADHSRPVAGYVGVIDERIDLDLVDGLAERLPDWDVHLVGPVLKLEDVELPARPNIKYFGQQEYRDLPELMGGFDVALMPFALNESTRSISPTKTLEYLAAGLPVVSTRVPDVVADYSGVVDLQDCADGFAGACRAVREHSLEKRDAKVDPILRLHHWDSIARRMEELVLDVADRPSTPWACGRDGGPFDYVIVGAGFAGSTLAERLANDGGKRVLLLDKRPHIGGNAYDYYDEHGILVHKYGPHIFHTNSAEVFGYLSAFTKWRRYEHRVLASVDGRLVPMPINLDTINELYGLSLTSQDVDEFLASVAEPIERCRTSEDVVVSKVGRDLYEKFFRNYTRKQWGLDPSELDASVTSRVPTRTNRDPRYFTDRFQAMPLHGYTRMFENMLDHPNVKIMLNTDYREVRDLFPGAEVIYTGPVDEYFGFRYGKLPYRSLRFEFETADQEVVQPAPVINFPNEHAYTRSTEFKYLTGQEHRKSTLVREFPTDQGDPYYPVPRPENGALYKRYKALADAARGVHFVGRLATYKYYNMDQVTAQALQTYGKLVRAPRVATTVPRTIRLDVEGTAVALPSA
jgi:UDP-galactopyranose mutase